MLNLNEPTPLCKQLRDLLRQQIVDEKLKPDHRIPSERALCQKYKISRITVRQAISDIIKVAEEAHKMERKAVPFSTFDLYGKTGPAAPKFVTQTFEAPHTDERLAPMMKVKKGATLFMIASIFQTGDHRPLEFGAALGDRYKFHRTCEFS